ncbi:hypothetical protein EW146_g5679 [Bondarzewia mesenterica]|uniref:MARVEL domain-containing protein n=1 Tax=Bondarzewia mesenterica TaxID=1095465 RepID=A0A4S4LQR7_9AGAM|nr:hypothetical protein EW146_g5679 [Bondarzewia mesenterica]
MPSKFNIIRGCVYSLVILWSFVCLAIAVHFQAILSPSDLTRFVPFAIFVSSASLAVMLAISALSLRRNMNPISTRIELACLGLVGTFWLALGAFLASSDSETASVECFASETDTVPIDVQGFSTETYQAQYRVLEAFSLFNVVLVWGFLAILFGLALRQYLLGNRKVWLVPVTAHDWFGKGPKQANKQANKQLPQPVTARRGGSTSKSTPARGYRERDERNEKRKPTTYSTTKNETYHVSMPQRARQSNDRSKYDYYRRDASPRR